MCVPYTCRFICIVDLYGYSLLCLGMRLPVGGRTDKSEKPLVRERQILIPEFCDIHPCSASMWRKLVCVPTILIRINSLLLSGQLATA